MPTILVFDKESKLWRIQSKEDVKKHKDIEGKCPCDFCWENARDYGTLAVASEDVPRCKCGRAIAPEIPED